MMIQIVVLFPGQNEIRRLCRLLHLGGLDKAPGRYLPDAPSQGMALVQGRDPIPLGPGAGPKRQAKQKGKPVHA